MDARQSCSVCGSPVSAATTEGFCPSCLIAGVLEISGAAWDEQVPEIGGGGEPFGNYTLLERIARGGMGLVYRARQRSPDRLVALKIIIGGALAEPSKVGRFRAEAEAVAKLEHPHIVPMYEVGEIDGHHFFSMRLIEGKNLSQALGGKPMEARAAAELLMTIAETVQYAHGRGILHRDIKPGNILLDRDGTPFLTDFGLAKMVEQDSNLSFSGAILGTPGYMSPEQAEGRGKEVTTASDVYGLGAVLYELLSGRSPFEGRSPLSVARQVISDEPRRLTSHNPAIPVDLETVCLKCLEKDPARRYPSARDLADDLARWLRHEPVLARPATRLDRVFKWIRRNPAWAALVLVAALALVVVVAGLAVFTVRLQGQRNVAREFRDTAERETASSQRLLLRSNLDRGIGLLDAGDVTTAQLWFAECLRLAADNAATAESIRRLIGWSHQHTPKLEHLWFEDGGIDVFAVSPDGETLLLGGGSQWATLRDLNTGAPGPPLESAAEGLRWATFSPAGDQLATLDSAGEVLVWDTESWSVTIRSDLGGEHPVEGHSRIRFHPSGNQLLAFSGEGALRVWDASTGDLLHELHPGSAVVNAEFSRSGNWIGAWTGANELRLWDAHTGEAAAHDFQHESARLEPLRVFRPGWDQIWTCSPGSYDLQLWDVASGLPVGGRVASDASTSCVAFDRDGTQMAVNSWTRAPEIWLLGDGITSLRSRQPARRFNFLRFSPDGASVFNFGYTRSLEVSSAASGRYQYLLPHPVSIDQAAWAPDGRRLITASLADGTVYVWRFPLPDDFRTLLIDGPLLQGMDTSADRRHLLVRCRDEAPYYIDLDHASDVQQLPLTGSASATAINHDGSMGCTVVAGASLQRWDLRNLSPLGPTIELPGIASVKFSEDGRLLGVLQLDEATAGSFRLFAADSGEEILAPQPFASRPSASAFDPRSELVAVGTESGELRVFSIADARVVFERSLDRKVQYIAFTPDSRTIAAGAISGIVEPLAAYVWDLESGELRHPPLPHPDGVFRLAIDPAGQRLFTADEEVSGYLWDLRQGSLAGSPLRHKHLIVAEDFSPDGSCIATGSWDGRLRIWNTANGFPLTPAIPHPEGDGFTTVRFCDGAQSLVSQGYQRVTLWKLTREDAPLASVRARAEAASGRAIDSAGSLRLLGREALRARWQLVQPEQGR